MISGPVGKDPLLDALGAVLAGGAGRRMGRDKALLDWHGVPLIVHVARTVATAVGEVIVVTRHPEEVRGLGLVVERDRHPAPTPLSGIATALEVAAGRPVFVAGCDMPLIRSGLVRMLLRRAEGHDAVVPVRRGRMEPLHAVWCPPALPEVVAALERGEMAPHRVLARLKADLVPEDVWRSADPGGVSMTNVNTPGDLAAALALSGGGTGEPPPV